MEKNWEKDLQEKLSKFSSGYDNLAEKLSAIENRIKERDWRTKGDTESRSSFRQFQKIGAKYYFIDHDNKLDWNEASEKCGKLKADLVSIQNEEEWRAISVHLKSNKSYWIDVNDIRNDGEYESGMSGQKAPFLKWEAREPNQLTSEKGAEHCVELRRDYNHYMNDIICSEKNYYICESKF
ncbi:hypothetical protein KR038_003620 [Drosophila bunnanda]|nr:hypothetical protein KR038_003620 [Drosophila bunnanda]